MQQNLIILYLIIYILGKPHKSQAKVKFFPYPIKQLKSRH